MIVVLAELFILRGVPAHIRSDNGPEFMAEAVQAWITAVGAKTAYIERGSPWENGYIESFNARLRSEIADKLVRKNSPTSFYSSAVRRRLGKRPIETGRRKWRCLLSCAVALLDRAQQFGGLAADRIAAEDRERRALPSAHS